MFDLVPESRTSQLAGGGVMYEHNSLNDLGLFKEYGSVQRVPIEAIDVRSFADDESGIVESIKIPNYHAIQNTRTGEILDTRPIGKTYQLVPHDTLFERQAELLAGSNLPSSNLSITDRIYDAGLRAHRTIYFNDLRTTIGDSLDTVVCRMDIFNSIDMSWAFQIFSGAYRDLCRNTCVFGGEKAYHQKHKHTKNLSPDALISKAGGSLEMWTEQRDQMRLWTRAKLSDQDFAGLLAETICYKPTRATDAGQGKPVNERRMNNLLYLFNKEKAELGNTMWAAYNALTHWATHTNHTWQDETGKEYQSGKNTADVSKVQRQRNDEVRLVLGSPTWQYFEGLAA